MSLVEKEVNYNMAKSKKEKLAEEFLRSVMGVDTKSVLDEVRALKDEDVYTRFITKDAVCSGKIDDAEMNEFLLKVYSDWYFLHKNTFNRNIRAVKLLSEYAYTPVKLSDGKSVLNMVKSHNFDDILPISIQYINKVEDKYFVAIRTDQLHNQVFPNCDYSVRLYLNLKADALLEFASIFLDRSYSNEFPAIVKILNNDFRSDTLTIYTDYEHASQVVATIEEIREENSSLFKGMGINSSLLGRVNDYIGFGEVLSLDNTYLYSRCKALSATEKLAEVEYLRKALMLDEEKMVKRSNGRTYTPTEYLEYLVERNAVALIEGKLEELENTEPRDKDKIRKLKEMLDNVWTVVDIHEEVNKLKRSFTRNVNYVLEIDGVGRQEFDYISRLYNVFGGTRMGLKPVPVTAKKDKISSVFFRTTDTFEGLNTREFLTVYFRTKLSYILQDVISNETEALYRSKDSTVLTRLKRKVIAKLKEVLGLIIDEEDEGKVYLDRYIFDLLRILSTDGLEMVETQIAGKSVPMDTSVPSEMISLLPLLQDEVKLLSENSVFVDNILLGLGINSENIALSSATENVCAKEEKKEEKRLTGYHAEREEMSMQTA